MDVSEHRHSRREFVIAAEHRSSERWAEAQIREGIVKDVWGSCFDVNGTGLSWTFRCRLTANQAEWMCAWPERHQFITSRG